MPTTIEGQIERITFANAENGFTVAQLRVHDTRERIVIVGNFAAISPGENLVITGEWQDHAKFGPQFQVSEYRVEMPATVEGIRRYLGSGLIKGIGPAMAERITRTFGTDTLRVMDTDINALTRVEGIGKKRVQMIQAAWEKQKDVRAVMIFLAGHGIGAGYAFRIYKTYGSRAIETVKADPYRLATDIHGIGFVTADQIAGKLGFAQDCPQRIRAGVVYVLNRLSEEGHVYYPRPELVDQCVEILNVDRGLVKRQIDELAARNVLKIEQVKKTTRDEDGQQAVYLYFFYACEVSIAAKMQALLNHPRSVRNIDADKAVDWVQEKLSITLADRQAEAVKTAGNHKMMVITGGPGTGKTTIIKAVLKIYAALKSRVLLAAPTGRAAKKLKEATGHESRTIHRLLEYSLTKGGFQRNSEHPLSCDLLVIDEASMIDTVLMHYLLQAVPLPAVLILVGDVNQLPSVGAGNVLQETIASGLVPTVTLNEIFRQARKSRIVMNAHRINSGVIPSLEDSASDSDFFFIKAADPDNAVDVIEELVRERIPRRFGFDPLDEIQVLTPMNRGTAGVDNLNRRLQQALNPDSKGLTRGENVLAVADKVMQVRNNYDKEVFNGDIGRVARLDPEIRQVTVDFDGRFVVYEQADLDEIVLAYAISVHKSQGSEYPVVVMPVLTQHYVMLKRNLIYTAVTRGRRLVVMVGSGQALAIGVKNDQSGRRYSGLAQRLRETQSAS